MAIFRAFQDALRLSVWWGALASIAICMVNSPAKGWGSTGHRIIAEVAEARLCSSARTEVLRLLSLEAHAKLSDVSTWADAARAKADYIGPRHAVRLPLNGGPFQMQRDCGDSGCAIPHLERYIGVLREVSRGDALRLEALKFITHLVGDLHQPFHGASDGLRRIVVSGRTVRLHAYWDSGMFVVARLRRRELGRMVKHRAAEVAEATDQLRPERWVEESRDIVRDQIMPNLGPRDALLPEERPAQLKQSVSIAVTRMAQASVRLAGVLSQAVGCRAER